MKIFRKLAALAAAVVTAVAALQVTAGAAKAPAWTYEAQELDSGKKTTCYLSKDGSWVDFQITAERDGVAVLDAKVYASKSKVLVTNSSGSSISTNSKTLTGTYSSGTYQWNSVSEYSEYTRSFPVKEGKVYFVRLAAGGKNVNGSLKAYLTVTVPEGNPFKNSPTVKSGRTQKLTLDTKSEEAYYTIDIPSKGVLSLGLDYEINNIRTILYDEDGNKVVPYDKSVELGSAQISTGSKYGYGSWKSSEKSGKCSFDYNVDAGTYYIWVSNTGNSNGTGDIRLTPTFTKESDAALTLLSVRVSKGGSVQLLATVSGKGSIQWSSSDSSIATVSDTGKVSGKSKGNAVITATCGGTSLSVNVTVV